MRGYTEFTLGCKLVQKCVCFSSFGVFLQHSDKENRCVHDKKLKTVHVDLFLLLHTHTVTDAEVIFNQSVSVCLGLNGLLQVNLDPY